MTRHSSPSLRLKRRSARRAVLLIIGAGLLAALLLAVASRPRPPRVLGMVTATALDDTYRPVSTTEVYGPQDVFYLSLELQGYRPNPPIRARWLYGTQVITEMDLAGSSSGDGYAGFELRNERPPWPAGEYQVEVWWEDQRLSSLSFRVEE